MRIKNIIGLVLISGLVFSFKAVARPGGPDEDQALMGPMNERMMTRMADELGLSEEQRKTIQELRKKHRGPMAEERQEVRALKEELAALMKSTEKGKDFNKTALEKFAKLQMLRAEAAKDRFNMALQIREILTAEQLEKFAKFKGEGMGMRAKMGPGRGHRFGHGGPSARGE